MAGSVSADQGRTGLHKIKSILTLYPSISLNLDNFPDLSTQRVTLLKCNARPRVSEFGISESEVLAVGTWSDEATSHADR